MKAWSSKIDEIEVPKNILNVINAVRKELTILNTQKDADGKDKSDEKYYISDRRWKKITHILRASAFLNGRSSVDLMDSSLIEYCVWSTEKQREEVSSVDGVVAKVLKQNGIDCDGDITKISEDIDEFKVKIDDEWFEKYAIKIVDGKQCYVCFDSNNKTYYVTKNPTSSSYHKVYDANQNLVRNASSFSKNGDVISCYETYTITKNLTKTLKQFSAIAHYTLQKQFDTENYEPIKSEIEDAIALLEKQKAESAEPFKANLFARQKYAEILLSKIDDAIKTLEDKKIALDKEHSRYFDESLKFTLSVGDVVLKDGIIFSQSEIDTMSEEQKEGALGVICITGEKNYLLGLIEESLEWGGLKDFKDHYGDKFSYSYSKWWMIPNKENLNKIWENSATINKSLEKLGQERLDGEYWANTEKEDNPTAAYYQIFSKDDDNDEGDDDSNDSDNGGNSDDSDNGKQDDATKTHKFSVRAIHSVGALR